MKVSCLYFTNSFIWNGGYGGLFLLVNVSNCMYNWVYLCSILSVMALLLLRVAMFLHISHCTWTLSIDYFCQAKILVMTFFHLIVKIFVTNSFPLLQFIPLVIFRNQLTCTSRLGIFETLFLGFSNFNLQFDKTGFFFL